MSPRRVACFFAASITRCAAFTLPLAAVSHRRHRRLLVAMLLLVLGPALAVHAQSAIFMGELQTLGSGIWAPYATAVDAQGDVWIASGYPEVYELQAVNGVVPANSSPIAVASGTFGQPDDIAIDSAGDVFVSDAAAGAIYEIVAVGGSIPASPTVKTIASVILPRGLAFDTQGNLWVAASGSGGTSEIAELEAVSGFVPVSPTVVTWNGVSTNGDGGAGFNQPQRV